MRRLIVNVSLVVLLAGCGAQGREASVVELVSLATPAPMLTAHPTVSTVATRPTGTQAPTPSLISTVWRLDKLEGSPVAPTFEATLEFPDTGSFSGLAGCNQYYGTYEATREGTFRPVGDIGHTLVGCDQDTMNVESKFVEAFRRTTTIRVHDGRLEMEDSHGQSTLTFVPTENASSPVGGDACEGADYQPSIEIGDGYYFTDAEIATTEAYWTDERSAEAIGAPGLVLGETPIPIPPEVLDRQCEREQAKVVIPVTPQEQGVYGCPIPRLARVTVYLNYDTLREGGRASAGIDPDVFELRLDGKPIHDKPKVRQSSSEPPAWAQLVYPLKAAWSEVDARGADGYGYHKLSLRFPVEAGGKRERTWEFQTTPCP